QARDERGAIDRDQARAIRCRACEAAITHADAKIEVMGRHEHPRTNPAGPDFLLGCFDDAPGCVSIGEASDHWSWFPPNAWRVAICASCRTHLRREVHGKAPFF